MRRSGPLRRARGRAIFQQENPAFQNPTVQKEAVAKPRPGTAASHAAVAPDACRVRGFHQPEAHGAPTSAGPDSGRLRGSGGLCASSHPGRRGRAGVPGAGLCPHPRQGLCQSRGSPEPGQNLGRATWENTSIFIWAPPIFKAAGRAEAVATLADFEKQYPESLLLRDARVLYGSALLAQNRAKDAIAVLEKDRQPPRADLELALGKAYAAAGEPAKAAEILRNLYVTMPLSAEAEPGGCRTEATGFDHSVATRGSERTENARRSAGQRETIQRCRGRISRPAQRGESERSSRDSNGAGGGLAALGRRQGSKEGSGWHGKSRWD